MSADGGPTIEVPRMPDGMPVASKDAPVGGQAVLEGVMMRGVSTWAVAVRTPAPEDAPEDELGEIEVTSEPLVSWAKRHRILRVPVIRGVVALAESLKIGFRALAISANAQLIEEEEGEEPETIGGFTWALTIIFSLVLAIGLFFVVPVGATSLIKDQLGSPLLFWLVEGVLRTAIFIGYIVAISRLPDLRRVFEYHGAEHKTISCFEAGDELVPERAEIYSRLHPRCGTSFLLIVMVLAIFVFAPIGLPEWYWLVLSRILGHPADRRALLRGHQVGGQEPPEGLGPRADVARPDAPVPHHPPARPLPARRRDRGARGRARRREPRAGRARSGRDRDRRLAAPPSRLPSPPYGPTGLQIASPTDRLDVRSPRHRRRPSAEIVAGAPDHATACPKVVEDR